MVKENNERGRALGRLNLTDKDVAKISQWIEDDSVSQDMYQERLNSILDLGVAIRQRRPGQCGLVRSRAGADEHLERNGSRVD